LLTADSLCLSLIDPRPQDGKTACDLALAAGYPAKNIYTMLYKKTERAKCRSADELGKTTAADMKKTDFKVQKDADDVSQQVCRRSIYQASIIHTLPTDDTPLLRKQIDQTIDELKAVLEMRIEKQNMKDDKLGTMLKSITKIFTA
jgi:hypothetical protein